jgi:hypothetical protein
MEGKIRFPQGVVSAEFARMNGTLRSPIVTNSIRSFETL